MEQQREQRLRDLAAMLLFKLEHDGAGYTLSREVDVSRPVRHDRLTLDQVEDIPNTWKLRGFHGG
jgi:hypothetical protein